MSMTEEDFASWKAHPGTQALMKVLALRREKLRRDWEGGLFTDYAVETTALVNVGNLGTCRGYAFVMDFSYEDYITEIENGE